MGRRNAVLDRISVPRDDSYTVLFSGSAPDASGVQQRTARLRVCSNVKVLRMKTVRRGMGIPVGSIAEQSTSNVTVAVALG